MTTLLPPSFHHARLAWNRAFIEAALARQTGPFTLGDIWGEVGRGDDPSLHLVATVVREYRNAGRIRTVGRLVAPGRPYLLEMT